MSFPASVYRRKPQFNGKVYWIWYSKCWTIFQRIHLWNWDICHAVGPIIVSLCRRSLPPGIGTSLSQNTVHVTSRPDRNCLNFVLQEDPLWRQYIDCCLVSVVTSATYVSSLVMIRSRNSSPSSWYHCRNVNADSMRFALCSGVNCYALCIQNFIIGRSRLELD